MNCKLLVWFVAALLLTACGSEDNPGDTDGDFEQDTFDRDLPPVDGDEDEIETEKPCEPGSCEGGLYCDSESGRCQACTEDLHCGTPDPISNITPVCRDGKCIDLVCPTLFVPEKPYLGADLPARPLQPEISEGHIFEDGRKVFPIGIQPLEPKRFEEAYDAGFNLVMSNNDCCETPDQLDYQLMQFLPQARGADLYSALKAVWPPEQMEGDSLAILLESIRDRSNTFSLLSWIGSDRAESLGYFNIVPQLEEFVYQANPSKLFAVAEDTGASIASLAKSKSFHIATLDATSDYPGSEISRVFSASPDKAIWARIPVPGSDPAKLIAMAMHALSHEAGGVVFEMNDEDAGFSPDDWDNAREAATYIHARRDLLLLPRDTTSVTLSPDKPELRLIGINVENKATLAIVVNGSETTIQATLNFTVDELPYCFGRAGENIQLHLSREQQVSFEIAPLSIVEFQFTEASRPGG